MNKVLILLGIAFVAGLVVGYIPAIASPGPGAPNPGHTASEIGGDTDAERTFYSTGLYTFQGPLKISGNLNVGGAVRVSGAALWNNFLTVKTGYGDTVGIGGDSSGNDVEIRINSPSGRNSLSIWNSNLNQPVNIAAQSLKLYGELMVDEYIKTKGNRFYAQNIEAGDYYWFMVNGADEGEDNVLGLYGDGSGNNKVKVDGKINTRWGRVPSCKLYKVTSYSGTNGVGVDVSGCGGDNMCFFYLYGFSKYAKEDMSGFGFFSSGSYIGGDWLSHTRWGGMVVADTGTSEIRAKKGENGNENIIYIPVSSGFVAVGHCRVYDDYNGDSNKFALEAKTDTSEPVHCALRLCKFEY